MPSVSFSDFETGKFSLYFYGYVPEGTVLPDPADKAASLSFLFGLRTHLVEITHNWGTEDPSTNFAGYHNGNQDPRGFGHLAVVVPDIYGAIERLEKEGVKIIKQVDGGSMKGIAFVADPDGYWIEFIPDAWNGQAVTRKE